MRRPVIRTSIALAVVLVTAAGCGGQTEPRAQVVTRPTVPRDQLVTQPTVRRDQLWSPKPQRPPAPTTTKVPLPYPVDIPDNPYAPEPVKRIGTMEIPKIGLTHTVFEGVTLHNIDQGPSHWPGTAVPGHPGNAVFAGHRTTNDHPFERIAELVPGDPVVFTINGTRTTYVVTGDLVVSPSDTWIADQTPAMTATLYACHPPGSVDQRYVVRMALAT